MYAERLKPLITSLESVERELESLINDGVVTERWSRFEQGRRAIRNGLRLLKRSLHV